MRCVGPDTEGVTHLVVVDVDHVIQVLAAAPQAVVGRLIGLVIGRLTVGDEVGQVVRAAVTGSHGALEEVGRGLEHILIVGTTAVA
ncbi:hypothetical protein D3C81_893370 [compost metagenome]